jgi:hypothetical protein
LNNNSKILDFLSLGEFFFSFFFWGFFAFIFLLDGGREQLNAVEIFEKWEFPKSEGGCTTTMS